MKKNQSTIQFFKSLNNKGLTVNRGNGKVFSPKYASNQSKTYHDRQVKDLEEYK